MRAGAALLGERGRRLGRWLDEAKLQGHRGKSRASRVQVERLGAESIPMTADDWRIVIRPDEVKKSAGESASEMARMKFDEAPVLSVLGRVLRVHTDERAWRQGATGERKVGKLLDKLPKDRWRVFNDVPLGSDGVNVDHLLIGVGGVYTINTKNLSGKVWLGSRALLISGQKTTYLRAAAAEARKVALRLSSAVGEAVEVTPVILLICEEMMVKERPIDVHVFRHREGVAWLKARPNTIPLAQASRIARSAGMTSTWN